MSLHELFHPDPATVSERDVPKFHVEAHKRLSGPLTAFSFAMVALVSTLTGAFRRHGGIIRPFIAIMAVVGLLALGLVIANLAARSPVLIPLIWVHAVAPGLICVWILFGPRFRARLLVSRPA
jgi:lipopolysaccharide export system permease protein